MSRLDKTEKNLALLRELETVFKEWAADPDLRIPADDPMLAAIECLITNSIMTLELFKDTLERVTKEEVQIKTE